ncbi:MAG: sugar phosphate isomerase/epimerase [Phycisphaeraceae bacterium]|nr:sugar phosphate isomerase/epimerase [Phycisphaeraceae bacterium]
MPNIPIALQLYSVRDDAKADLAAVLQRVKKMGYDGVEFAGLYGHEPAAVKKMCADSGLKPFSAHVPIDQLQHETWKQTAESYRAIGCDHLIVPFLPEKYRTDMDAWLNTAEFFCTLDQRLQSVGCRTGFHAHWMDLMLLPSGVAGWELIAGNTPATFIMQYDTANGMHGGADPVKPIRDHYHRGQLLHLKEYIKVADGVDPKFGHGQAVIGEGGVPWNDVFDAAEQFADTRLYIVEQEGHPTLSPMDAAARCASNLIDMLKARS